MRYRRTFHGRADQVSRVRREVVRHLAGHPASDETVLIVSELAANALLHSRSRGEFFTVRCEVFPDHVRVEVEDLGGPWRRRKGNGHPRGLDIVEALTGPEGWGTKVTSDETRVVWARLEW